MKSKYQVQKNLKTINKKIRNKKNPKLHIKLRKKT